MAMSDPSDGGDDDPPTLEEVFDMELDPSEEMRYIVLFDEDYHELLLDSDDSVAFLVDCNQAVEILRLASKTVAALAPDDAPDEEPMDAMIQALQEADRDE
jgi:hypothetical protein